MAQTAKIVEAIFENAIDTYEDQDKLIDLTTQTEPDPAMMQNANNVVWRSVQQHAPILNGWDLAGQDQDIIEESYPSILEEPTNDIVKQRADAVRDTTFWERRGKQSGRQQATEMNKRIAERMAIQGTMFYNSTTPSGYNFIAEGQALLNERQAVRDESRCYLLNDRDNLKFSSELSGRQTVQGMPEAVWKTGQIANDVAEFNVYTASFLQNINQKVQKSRGCPERMEQKDFRDRQKIKWCCGQPPRLATNAKGSIYENKPLTTPLLYFMRCQKCEKGKFKS